MQLTGGGEVGDELARVGAVVGAAVAAADARVAAAEEDGDAARAELGEERADALRIVGRDGLLVVAVGGGDRLRDRALGEDVVEPVEVGLVRVRRGVAVRLVRRGAAGRVVNVRRRVGDTLGILDVKVRLQKASRMKRARRSVGCIPLCLGRSGRSRRR